MSKRTVPCECEEDWRATCPRCAGTGKLELGENEFEWRGDIGKRGTLLVGVDGSIQITPNDTYYRGVMSAKEARALAIRILELDGGLDIRALLERSGW